MKDIDNEIEYEGVIDSIVIDNESIELTLGKVYEATLEEESFIQEVTGIEIKKYTLVDLRTP